MRDVQDGANTIAFRTFVSLERRKSCYVGFMAVHSSTLCFSQQMTEHIRVTCDAWRGAPSLAKKTQRVGSFATLGGTKSKSSSTINRYRTLELNQHPSKALSCPTPTRLFAPSAL